LESTNQKGQEAKMNTPKTTPPSTEAAIRELISDNVSMLNKALSLLQTTDLETVARHIEEQNYGLAKSELYSAVASVKHARDSIEHAYSELSGAVEA
jgi:hypothetical protein